MTEKLVKTLLVIEPSAEAPRNSEGAILRLNDGRLFLAYSRFTGGAADNSSADIASRISGDNGLSWSDDAVLVENEGRENVMSVSILRLESGDILLFYLVKNGWDDCKLYVRRSSDEMRTVGDRQCTMQHEGYHVVNNDRVVQLSSGRLVIPAAHHVYRGAAGGLTPGTAMCFLSDDQGHTWRKGRGELSAPARSRSGLQEPGVVELSGGRLYMWMRTDMGCQFESFSEDGGETWSEARPSPIASPLAPASMKRVPWGDELLLVWNDHSGTHPYPQGRRSPLCTAISRDEGGTWERSKILEPDPDGWYCYTSITFVGDAALLAYCAGDSQVGRLNRLKVMRIPKDWVYR